MDILFSLVVLIIMLVFIWAVVWAIQTYVIAGAPFIAEPFKAIISWVLMVVAVLVSIVLVWNWVSSIGFGGGTGLRPFGFRRGG
jgi:hypothetical protein